MSLRFLFFFTLLIMGIFLPFWYFLLGSLLYVLLYPGHELFVIALLIDGVYGTSTSLFPYTYTIAVLSLTVFGIYVKPYLKFYA